MCINVLHFLELQKLILLSSCKGFYRVCLKFGKKVSAIKILNVICFSLNLKTFCRDVLLVWQTVMGIHQYARYIAQLHHIDYSSDIGRHIGMLLTQQ